MSSFGETFSVEKLEVRKHLNNKCASGRGGTPVADAVLPNADDYQRGDMWVIYGNTDDPTTNGVYIHDGTAGASTPWQTAGQMNTGFGGGGGGA